MSSNRVAQPDFSIMGFIGSSRVRLADVFYDHAESGCDRSC
jgi:hypothetical protein